MATEVVEQEPVAAVSQPATKAPPAKKAAKKKKPRATKAPAKKAAVKKKRAAKSATKPARKKHSKRRSAAKKSVRKKTAAKKSAPKKRKVKKQPAVSKAQAIRDTAKELGRKARPRDIIAALAEKGIKVVSAQVSMTLRAAGMRRRRRRRKLAAAIARKPVTSNGKALNIDELHAVKKLADQLGGTGRLKELAAILERLV